MSSKFESDCLNLSKYQELLFQEETNNIYKTVDIKRKCMAQMLNASFSSVNNRDVCSLLESRLNKYSEIITRDGKNIYDDPLKQLLSQSNKQILQTNISNLDDIDINSRLKSISHSTKKTSCCNVTEIYSDTEFNKFLQVVANRKGKSSKSQCNKASNLKEVQQCKLNSSSYPLLSVCKEDNIKKVNEELYDKKNTYPFKTAREELQIQDMKKYGNSSSQQGVLSANAQGQKRKLGTRRNINSKFISPLLPSTDSNQDIKSDEWPSDVDERLKNIEPKMVELIKSEIMDCGPSIQWDDIAGLSFAKTSIQEAVVWPMLRPDIFTGLRRPPKGILLFGPPGTGKTLIGKCVASQSKSTFFSISASSLTSKWIGDGEKMVRALFAVAVVHQPSVIFIDEIDSLLSQRSDSEHESSRRIKTEFLVRLDGATTENDDKVLVIGATNRPQELDEAARRRFVKRLYIPLPEFEARLQLATKLISTERHFLTNEDLQEVATLSDGYSGADIRNLCSEAALGPIRSIDMNLIEQIEATEVRPLIMEDFKNAFSRVKSSVSPKDLEQYIIWNKTYGSDSGY